MATLFSGNKEPEEAFDITIFKRNTRLALNDASMFLEPSIVNVQALMLLGLHGEDFASPNLSWMLVGHACRQAQALGLHLPGAGIHRDLEAQQRNLCVFWALFAADKSCSLAFGRPCFLPTPVYEQVRQPDFEFLCRFRPHNTQGHSTFGACHFLQTAELAKITGRVLEFLGSRELAIGRNRLKDALDSWWLQTEKVYAPSYFELGTRIDT